MKKKIRLLSRLCFTVLLLFSVNIGVLAETDGTQEALTDAYEKILDSFAKDENGYYQYPEDYAGAYPDMEGNQLVLLLTDSANQDNYQQIAGNVKLDVQIAEYSYNQLKSYADPYWEKLRNDGASVLREYVDVTRNAYVFELSNIEQGEINELPTIQDIKEQNLPIICQPLSTGEPTDEALEMEEKVTKAYDRIIETFQIDYDADAVPDDFAGAYINVYDKENGELILLLTDDANEVAYREAAGDVRIHTRMVKYNYRELAELGKEYQKKLEADNAVIARHGVDVLRNAYTFGITADQETIDAMPTVQSIKEEKLPIICETSGEIVAATSSESSSESGAMIMISVPVLAVICIAFGLLLIAVVILLARRNRK